MIYFNELCVGLPGFLLAKNMSLLLLEVNTQSLLHVVLMFCRHAMRSRQPLCFIHQPRSGGSTRLRPHYEHFL